MSEVAEFKWGFKVAKSKSPQISADLTWALKVSVTAPRTPPPSKRRIIYQSPNQDHLRDALLEGGSSYSQLSGQGPNSTSEQIQFFAINDCSLNDLLADRRFQGFGILKIMTITNTYGPPGIPGTVDPAKTGWLEHVRAVVVGSWNARSARWPAQIQTTFDNTVHNSVAGDGTKRGGKAGSVEWDIKKLFVVSLRDFPQENERSTRSLKQHT
ncbi:hypothetical protein R3P38DRAFT_2772116 [Favolaschia claudopus]|uniref:Uncharacterized protein n=1 Tax=Favolaschia claudopus TaxID=2862362 RepID=A0AAW0CA18_9AGAR